MISKEQHNIVVDAIIDEIGSLKVFAMSEEVEKDFEEIINDVINYIGERHYK